MGVFFQSVGFFNISFFSIPIIKFTGLYCQPTSWRLSAFFSDNSIAMAAKKISKVFMVDILKMKYIIDHKEKGSSINAYVNNDSLRKISAGAFAMQFIWFEEQEGLRSPLYLPRCLLLRISSVDSDRNK